ncbi:hypothetical protein [Segeticoccus rhizosphaerae]|uniref:hypothetical protein n=1 Tax=Segeticoccus rhizosphaerae TaxID=1104777 RepID=UPI001264BF5A|nr:hypothetical protein [Segeticoccus rhizosphaerae]
MRHGALAYLLGINALRASETASVKSEDYQEAIHGHQVLHPVGKVATPATMPLTIPSCASWKPAARTKHHEAADLAPYFQ